MLGTILKWLAELIAWRAVEWLAREVIFST